MIKNSVYSFQIKDWDESEVITGIFLSEGEEWIMIYDNPNDFIIDGIRFLNKKKITKTIRDYDELFKEKVFELREDNFANGKIMIDLDNTFKLLKKLYEDKVLIQYDCDESDMVYIGEFTEINDDNFKLKSLTTLCVWSDEYFCKYTDITSISIKNDYLNSLELIIKHYGGNRPPVMN